MSALPAKRGLQFLKLHQYQGVNALKTYETAATCYNRLPKVTF